MNRYLVATLLALSLPISATAQIKTVESVADAQFLAARIVANLTAENYAAAWKELRSVYGMPMSELDVAEARFSAYRSAMKQSLGEPTGYEVIGTSILGTSVLRYTYLIRFENAPLRLRFVFYRASKGWVVTAFSFDDSTPAFFEDRD